MQRKTTVTAHRRYRGNPARVFAGIIILTGLLLAGCNNPLSPPEDTPATKGGLVRLVIGDTDGGNARTVQPAATTLAGYQFTFSDNAHEPVDVTAGNGAEVYLADGTYTITATAYRAGGTLGNSDDAAASGSVSVTLLDEAVTSNGGVVPPIILYPGYGSGALGYSITSAAAVGGTMKLWYANGNPYYDFGSSGVLTIGASPALSAETFSLTAGRYILEIRLEDVNGDIALLREVVEIWAGVTTAIVFAPTVYLDPSAVPAYSGTTLSATSIIGGLAIGALGAGSGADETNAVSYSLKVLDIVNVAQSFILETDSLFADISWTANTGTEPGDTGYSDTPVTDFSTDNILWVKVVSEDASAVRYYRFTLTNSDLLISGDGSYTYTGDVLRITGDGTYTIGMYSGVATATQNRIEVASGVSATITLNSVKIDRSADGTAFDMSGATVDLILIGANELKSGSNQAGAGLQAPYGSILTINAADATNTLIATGGGYGAGIGGGFRDNGGTITISGGTVTATTSGQYGAGIGGGRDGDGGTVTINGGVVIATGGYRGVGGGGGSGGGGGTITELSGNAVVFASSIGPTLTAGDNATQAIVFIGATGTVYGNVTLQQDLTIPAGYTLHLTPGNTLTIPDGVTLTNNGVIYVANEENITGIVTGNQPRPPSLIVTGSEAYTYESGWGLIITGDGTYAIGMRAGVSVSNDYHIVVASGVTANITLNEVNIDMSGSNASAFDMAGATVELTLTGTNVLKSGIANGTNGMPGVHVPEGANLTITAASAGSLEAVGGAGTYGGAGIGGGRYVTGGAITINGGTVIATSNGYYYGSGIGGGFNGNGGIVTITGGTVTAIGSPGIGGDGSDNNDGYTHGTIEELSGNAVVFASSIGPLLTAGDNATQAIVFNGNIGTVYGNVTLQQNLTIQPGQTLKIPAHNTLTIPGGGVTLTNNGTIIKYFGGVINGTVTGNQPVDSDLTITGDVSYTYDAGLLTITGNGTYTVAMGSGVSSTTTDRMVVASGVTATITFNGVNIEVSGVAFDMTGATVQLTLTGTNVLKSGADRAGLEVPAGSTLIINAVDDTQTLTVTGGEYGAGIGGGRNGAGGTITINNGTITATSSSSDYGGAGIGGGRGGSGGTITINDGTVTATGSGSDYGGAGIGGGYAGAGGSVTIDGGTVIANGSAYSAGIGGGYTGAGGSVTISNGTVTATGGDAGAGLGGGRAGRGGTITISGGTIIATGGSGTGASAGIGGGAGGYGADVTITGGLVTATATSTSGQGIGGSNNGTINLSGNAVVFASSNSGSPIGSILYAGSNATQAIAFQGATGTMYGSVTLQQDVTIPGGSTLNLSSGNTLTIPGNVTLTNNGTINKNGGTIVGTVGGTVN